MSIKVGINGFGRIGRMVFRASLNHPEIEIVGINDLCPADYLAYMLKYDTMHGRFAADVKSNDYGIVVNECEELLLSRQEPLAVVVEFDAPEELDGLGRKTLKHDPPQRKICNDGSIPPKTRKKQEGSRTRSLLSQRSTVLFLPKNRNRKKQSYFVAWSTEYMCSMRSSTLLE